MTPEQLYFIRLTIAQMQQFGISAIWLAHPKMSKNPEDKAECNTYMTGNEEQGFRLGDRISDLVHRFALEENQPTAEFYDIKRGTFQYPTVRQVMKRRAKVPLRQRATKSRRK